MVGPVDFNKDMDFWQQDKWSGSFPVKWHIIKDVPNTNFRHIVLENNENKPVTNSRDTQEVCPPVGFVALCFFFYEVFRMWQPTVVRTLIFFYQVVCFGLCCWLNSSGFALCLRCDGLIRDQHGL